MLTQAKLSKMMRSDRSLDHSPENIDIKSHFSTITEAQKQVDLRNFFKDGESQAKKNFDDASSRISSGITSLSMIKSRVKLYKLEQENERATLLLEQLKRE